MDLTELRSEIDQIDDQLVELFVRRMQISGEIADYKLKNQMPIFVPAREREKLQDVAKKAGPEMEAYTRVLYSMLFELSRSYQGKCNRKDSLLHRQIADAIGDTPNLFPRNPAVACQGVEGSVGQIACEKMVKNPFILYFKNYEGVFSAIEQGLCQYGVLPIENASVGSVKKVYDLLIDHDFSIVRTVRVKVDHNLLVHPGVKLDQIREIYSHERAIAQCSGFLRNLPDVKVIAVENTAAAAKLVADSGRTDVAALSSRICADLYNLEVAASAVQDPGSNQTRFVCISKNLEIYPGSDKTSIMMVLPHRPGSLYKVLARLYVLGINVTKVESRPIPDRDFEFMCYFDLDTSIYSDEYVQLMCELDDLCEEFQYLGSYREVV